MRCAVLCCDVLCYAQTGVCLDKLHMNIYEQQVRGQTARTQKFAWANCTVRDGTAWDTNRIGAANYMYQLKHVYSDSWCMPGQAACEQQVPGYTTRIYEIAWAVCT